ncbi:DotD/TraH family lipoprotein [Aureimonas ureilytica]|uniref:DotD/TraH family lipoprotein n=1 Tax=Aureimonas ureilytica TaxID=401562 RepID=UPI000380F040|nr:DotD/TraH family lipoprotein [Aureimonas ureilytica]
MREIAIIVALCLPFAGCAKAPPPDLTGISGYIAQQTAFTEDQKAYAARRGALAGYNAEAVQLVPNYPSDELFRLVDSRWNGTVEDLTQRIAKLTGYRVAASGEKPGAPIAVAVNQADLTAIGLLREGFAQARTRATLTIDQNTRVMTIRYKRPEASPVPHQDDTTL